MSAMHILSPPQFSVFVLSISSLMVVWGNLKVMRIDAYIISSSIFCICPFYFFSHGSLGQFEGYADLWVIALWVDLMGDGNHGLR